MSETSLVIDYLANHPQWADELAGYSYGEWAWVYRMRGMSLPDVIRSYRGRSGPGKLPITFIATQDGRFAGTASLDKDDLETRPELAPWLAAVYVVESFRKKGIGAALVDRLVEEAGRLGFPRLYLWTPSAQAFFGKLGWEILEDTAYGGRSISIMLRVLDSGHAD